MKNNLHYQRIIEALDTLEGMSGPSEEEYILIASEVIKELSQRIQNVIEIARGE